MKNGTRLSFVVKLAAVVIMCFCIVSIFRMRSEYDELTKTRDRLEAEKEKYEMTIDRLRTELNHEMNEEYVRRIAAEKLNYYLPDEIIFYSGRGGG